MGFFWTLVLAVMMLMLWWYALRAAFVADRREKVTKKLEGWLHNKDS